MKCDKEVGDGQRAIKTLESLKSTLHHILLRSAYEHLIKMRSEGQKPKPRLMHIQPGHSFTLAERNAKERVMLSRCDKYAYYLDSKGLKAKAALYHEVVPNGMIFGDGDGWRMK